MEYKRAAVSEASRNLFGDIIDVFNHSYVVNLRLITGYVNDDKAIIHEVQQKGNLVSNLLRINGTFKM